MGDSKLAERVRQAMCSVDLGPDQDTICDIFEPAEIDRFVAAVLEAIPEPELAKD